MGGRIDRISGRHEYLFGVDGQWLPDRTPQTGIRTAAGILSGGRGAPPRCFVSGCRSAVIGRARLNLLPTIRPDDFSSDGLWKRKVFHAASNQGRPP
jgi:hypothetical protein